MPKLLTTKQVAELLRYSVATVQAMRQRDEGPKPIRLSRTRVVYDEAEVLNWLKQKAAA